MWGTKANEYPYWDSHYYQCSHKQPPSLLLKLNQILNSFTPVGSFMLKWPEKNHDITCKLFLDFIIINTLLHVLIDVSEKGQIWNGFDNSEAKLGHRRKILTISGHLDIIQLILDKNGRKIGNLGQSSRGIENGSPKHLIWHFHIKKSGFFPHFSALCGSIFKNKVRICSKKISPIQKCPEISKKLA